MCIRDSNGRFQFDSKSLQVRQGVALSAATQATYLVRVQVTCLLYTSDAADERSSVDLGGRRIIKKKTGRQLRDRHMTTTVITAHHR